MCGARRHSRWNSQRHQRGRGGGPCRGGGNYQEVKEETLSHEENFRRKERGQCHMLPRDHPMGRLTRPLHRSPPPARGSFHCQVLPTSLDTVLSPLPQEAELLTFLSTRPSHVCLLGGAWRHPHLLHLAQNWHLMTGGFANTNETSARQELAFPLGSPQAHGVGADSKCSASLPWQHLSNNRTGKVSPPSSMISQIIRT